MSFILRRAESTPNDTGPWCEDGTRLAGWCSSVHFLARDEDVVRLRKITLTVSLSHQSRYQSGAPEYPVHQDDMRTYAYTKWLFRNLVQTNTTFSHPKNQFAVRPHFFIICFFFFWTTALDAQTQTVVLYTFPLVS